VQAIASVSPLPFLAVDGHGAVTAWNAVAEELLGGCAKDVLGHPLANDAVRELVERALDGESVRGELVTWLRDDGSALELLISATPVHGNGALAFALPVVDAPAHVENVLEGTRIAHELNNVMTAIVGYAQLLQLHAGDEERVRRDGKRIADAAQRATTVAQHLTGLVRRAAARTPALQRTCPGATEGV